ncbi:DUF4430 domain-containing protein [Sulfurimonas sp. HSL3-7]|uniref:DUF4430 domain-containing protein n=1 Tax=Sulfonitrofixus jiaomeiensis TaxID=3131938 RepID=UPI0031F87793
MGISTALLRALITSVLFVLLPSALCASPDKTAKPSHLETQKSITVEIDYGGLRPARSVKTSYVEGMSALQLLQQVAEVKTHKVGAFVFVRSIDKIKSERGKMGWFYSIDGVAAKTLAKSRLLENAKEMKWSYQVEACY